MATKGRKKKPKAKSQGGRPTCYNVKIGAEICSRIAAGESLRRICLSEHLPNKATVFRWLLDNTYPEFCDHYAKARAIQWEGLSDEIFDIADDGRNDWVQRELASGETIDIENKEAINRSRLRVDTRKWFLSKVLAKKYGDKIEVPKEPEAEKPHEATKRIIISEPKPKRLAENE